MCVFWLLYQSAVPPSLSLSAGLLIPWDTATLKLVQLMPLQWSINVQMKEIHMFLTLNQNLEMIKRSEEGMSKAEIFWKLGLLYYLAKSWMQRKSFFWRKLKVLFQWKIAFSAFSICSMPGCFFKKLKCEQTICIMLQPVFAFENIPESTFSHMMLEASKLAYHTDTAMY